MRAVNLLPPDLRSGPKGTAPAVSTGAGSGAGAYVVLGVLAFAVVALAAYVLAGNTVKDRKAELAAATAKSAAVTQQVAALSRTPTSRRSPTPACRPSATWRTRASTGSRRCATSPAPCRPTSRSPRSRATSARREAGGGSAARRDPGPGDRAQGCTNTQTEVARLMARLRNVRRRDPRVPLEVRQGGHVRRRRRRTATAPNATGYCGKGRPRLRARRLLRGRGRRGHRPDPRRGGRDPGDAPSTTRRATATPAAGAPATAATAGATPAPAGAAPATPAPATSRPPRPPLNDRDQEQNAPDRGRRRRGGHRRLLLPRPRAQARGGDEPGAQIATKQTEIQTAQATLASYRRPKDDYRKNYATVVRLGKAVPEDDDVRSLMVQLDAEAGGTTWTSARSRSAAPARPRRRRRTPPARPARPPPPGAAVGTAGFPAMPFSFAFRGSFFNLSHFFARLERFVRCATRS